MTRTPNILLCALYPAYRILTQLFLLQHVPSHIGSSSCYPDILARAGIGLNRGLNLHYYHFLYSHYLLNRTRVDGSGIAIYCCDSGKVTSPLSHHFLSYKWSYQCPPSLFLGNVSKKSSVIESLGDRSRYCIFLSRC